MKLLDHDVQNVRIIALALRLVSLPVAIPVAIYRWARSRFGRPTAKQQHEQDQLRQSRVRRELRGLPPDHDTSRSA